MLERDVNNISTYYAQYAPELLNTQYSKEIWALYEAGELHPEVALSGHFEESMQIADVDAVLAEIQEVMLQEQQRQDRLREAAIGE